MARAYYEKAMEINNSDANLITDAGVAYRRLKQPEKAVEYFRLARKTDPTCCTSARGCCVASATDPVHWKRSTSSSRPSRTTPAR